MGKGNIATVDVYARFSKAKGDNGVSLDDQVAFCQEFIAAQGFKLGKTLKDPDHSAADPSVTRPGWEELLQRAERGKADAVVFYRYDRAYRRHIDYARLDDLRERQGYHFLGVRCGTDSRRPETVITGALNAGMASHEVSVLKQRTRDALLSRAKRGEVAGGRRPFGWADNKTEHHTEEAKVLREMYERVLQGEKVGSLVQELRRRGIKTTAREYERAEGSRKARRDEHGRILYVSDSEGNPVFQDWTAAGLRHTLANPRNAGHRVHQGEVLVENVYPPIVEREVFEAVQVRLNGSRRGRIARPRTYLLTGLIYCHCGAKMTTRPTGDGYRRYACQGAPAGKGCGRTFIMAEGTEAIVAEYVLAEITKGAEDAQRYGQDADARSAYAELESARARMTELADMLGSGDIDPAQYKLAMRPAQERLAKAEQSVDQVTAQRALAGLPDDPEQLVRLWDEASLDRKRAITEAVVERVVVLRGKRGFRGVDPRRLQVRFRESAVPAGQ